MRGQTTTGDGEGHPGARIRHLVVDRDGVLNEEAPAGGYVTRPEDWHWIPGSLEALVSLAHAGVRVSIATNQSGVGRGLMTCDDLDAVHARMRRDVLAAGGRVDAIFACTHAPGEGCACRKPSPGLISEAVARSSVGPAETLAVGDDVRDLEAARRAGVRVALVLTGKGRGAAERMSLDDTPVYDDLNALVTALFGRPMRDARENP